MQHGDEETLRLFIDESREHLGNIEEDLLSIEQGGADAPDELVDKVFRAIHTVKGSAAFFAFTRIKDLAHAMESVLGKVRSHELVPSSTIISVLLDSADALRSMINDVGGSEQADISAYVGRLEDFLRTGSAPADSEPSSPSLSSPSAAPTELRFTAPVSETRIGIDLAELFAAQQEIGGNFVFIVELEPESDDFAKDRSESDISEELGQITRVLRHKYSAPASESPRYLVLLCCCSFGKDILTEYLGIPEERVSQVLAGKIKKDAGGQLTVSSAVLSHLADENEPSPAKSKAAAASTGTAHGPASNPVDSRAPSATRTVSATPENSLRVNIHTLDKLMTLAGELVLTRNELLQNAASKDLANILSASQRVDGITSELQEAIMSTRMQSIGIVLGKFRRVVRDLAKQLDKQILLEIEGEEVELDKSIIEAVGDPLTHLVRNAVDHGIESPEVRTASGKSAQGLLSIKAYHEAGHVVIEIADDGKGIDPSAIRKKARSSGVVDETTLASMSDREVVKLIFRAGFSTAEKVTDISGRGVGMDVVQSNLKKVGGAVDIESVAGKGTTLRIKLPLTLAIIPSLLVVVEEERYAIPQTNLVELVRIPAADVKRRLEMVGGCAVLRLRGELLPLICLNDVLGIEKTCVDKSTGLRQPDRRRSLTDRRGASAHTQIDENRRFTPDRRKSPTSAVNIVVVSAGSFKYGLIVDSLLDSSEIVVKPLGYHLSDCREYAGATIMGDGQVALILDVVGIRKLLELRGDVEAVSSHADQQAEKGSPHKDHQSFLLVENGEEEFFAVPVGLTARIEKIPQSAISTTGGKQAVQYRGATLRLFSIEDVAQVAPRKKGDYAYIVIFRIASREVGIIVSEIVDTVDISDSQLDSITHVQPGILGSSVVRDSITLILDLFGIVKACAPELCGSAADPEEKTSLGRILIVEDSAFFSRQIRLFMEDAGYETVCAEDGVKGLAVLKNSGDTIDLVLTDIEMPHMNGLDMTRAIREQLGRADLPIIAVTSVSGEKAEKAGREAGIDEYLIKLEREAILAACERHLNKQNKNTKIKEMAQ